MNLYEKKFQPLEVVLVFINEEPAFFARVENVKPDIKKKWWQLTLLMLTIPLKTIQWKLDDDQMRGHPFTMKSVPMQIRRVERPQEEYAPPSHETKPENNSSSNVISLFDDE